MVFFFLVEERDSDNLFLVNCVRFLLLSNCLALENSHVFRRAGRQKNPYNFLPLNFQINYLL